MSNSDYASQKLATVRARIASACETAQRPSDSVSLIGASKKQAIDLISQFAESGLRDFGENYLQEAIDKQRQLPNLSVDWHFIGQIQSNKTKLIAEHFDWVHGVDRLKIATRLATQHGRQAPINILMQLNPDNEDSKAGVALKHAAELCQQISEVEGARLRGFMMIPRAREHQHQQQAVFAQARELLERCNQQYGLNLDHLSMGMSGDLEAAIAEGSTMVRIGTDLFGARA
ncbi:MAG: pyridoxal phosphate enzyme (YggS family) [Arenicella sp.]|jgi:pyridoxal phosphate enzyme (YggS family)